MSDPATGVAFAIAQIKPIPADRESSWLARKARDDLLRQAAGRTKRLDEEEAVELAAAIGRLPVLDDCYPVAGADGWLRAIARSFPDRPLPARLREALSDIQRRLEASPPRYAPGRKLVRLVEDLLPEDAAPVIDENDDWGALAAPLVAGSPDAVMTVV